MPFQLNYLKNSDLENKMKIMVVGDLHGDWGRLNALITKKKPDVVFCCGDFGWWPALEGRNLGGRKKWMLKGVKPGGTKVYFCDGNHEQFPALPAQDGNIHEMYKNIFYCSRGSRLVLPDSRVVMFAGGAESIDKNLRTPGYDWFSEETIKDRDLDKMLNGPAPEIVISHTCPISFYDYLYESDKNNDPSCLALEYVLSKFKPKMWFFGHYHTYKDESVKDCRFICLDYPGHGGRWWAWL